MATPHDLYLRFLVTKGMDDFNEVIDELEVLEMRGTSDKDFAHQFEIVEKNVPSPINEQIRSGKYEGDFLKWMKILEVDDLWRTERAFRDIEKRKALMLIQGFSNDPQLRIAINALLIKNCDPQDLCASVNGKFASLLKPEHIKFYSRFFFDPRRMTRSDWKRFLKDCDSKEKSIYFVALSESVDVVKAELELPTQVNTSEILQNLLHKSYQRARVYLEFANPDANREARQWIDTALKLVDKYEKFKIGDKNDFAKLLSMEFDFVDDSFPTPDQETLLALQSEAERGSKTSQENGEAS